MIRDLALGVRLAFGGGKISGSALLRLAMTMLGIAFAVAVLLPAASVGNLAQEREARSAAATPVEETRPGIAPLYQLRWSVESRGESVTVMSVAATGGSSPVPPGLTAVPGPGELVVSPAVARILESADGDALRARLPAKVVGEIGKPGLVDASDLTVYSGEEPTRLAGEKQLSEVYGFGVPTEGFALSMALFSLVAPAVVALLLPLLIFVTTASRMGAAQRDRRLAALRLIGVDSRQVRRIAAAESLVGAAGGLLLGVALFLAVRPLIGELELAGTRFFAEDFAPTPILALLVVVAVPMLSVGAAIFGLRRTIVDPLGVVRQGRPIRRRMWWRWAIVAAGVLLLTCTWLIGPESGEDAGILLTVGATLLLVGVPAVLPWAIERLVRGRSGGSPSWQLAMRRLQLDSGTSSRVVSGLVVVLAGVVLIQVLTASIGRVDPAAGPVAGPAMMQVRTDAEHLAEVGRRAGAVPGVTGVHELRLGSVGSADEPASSVPVEVGTCAALAVRADIGACADGDVFLAAESSPDRPVSGESFPPGPLAFLDYDEAITEGPQWTLPERPRQVRAADRSAAGSLLITPGAVGAAMPAGSAAAVFVDGSGGRRELGDRLAGALNHLGWQAQVVSDDRDLLLKRQTNSQVGQIRAGLLGAAAFVLAVAALSLLMLSVEQITERRRPLAALAASGVPVSLLARSNLWQSAIPVVVGVVLAVAAGLGLAVPILHVAGVPMQVDAGLITGLAGIAVLAALASAAATWPLLRSVTRLDSLRAE